MIGEPSLSSMRAYLSDHRGAVTALGLAALLVASLVVVAILFVNVHVHHSGGAGLDLLLQWS